MSLTKKIDFAVVFSVKNANPNGDPLNGNRPRITYEGLGELTDVCIKRKIRNRLMDVDKAIFVQSDDNKNDNHSNLRSRAEEVLSVATSSNEVARLSCEKWFDVRAFGQVFPFKAKSGKKSKARDKEGAEVGEDKGVSIGIRGPVSVQSAFSIFPVSISSNQITKCTSLEGDGIKRQSDQMGMKHRVDRGIYVFYGSMNSQLSVKTGFSDDDAKVIKDILPRLFENDASSARPEGSMEVLKVVWWQHNSKSGQSSSAKVHRSLTVNDTGNMDKLLSFEPGKGPGDKSENWPQPEIINGI
jgi:CRISPR-associated protein Csd2